jgi:RHS repeat-associated protein
MGNYRLFAIQSSHKNLSLMLDGVLRVLVILSMAIPNAGVLAANPSRPLLESESNRLFQIVVQDETPSATPTNPDLPTETLVPTEEPTDQAPTETATPGNDPEITPTTDPETTLTPLPSETETPVHNEEPTLTSTPIVDPGEPTTTPTPLPTSSATPELTSTVTPTATQTLTPTPGPTLDINSLAEYKLNLQVEPGFITPGGTADLFWQVEGWDGRSSGLELLISVPPCFEPLVLNPGKYDADASTLRIPLTASKGQIVWKFAKDSTGPFTIQGELFGLDLPLASNWVILRGKWESSILKSGGSASAAAGKIRVNFPIHALENIVNNSLAVRISDPLIGSAPYFLGGMPFEILAEDADTKQVVRQFSQPLTIEVEYDDHMIQGEESDLSLFYFDEELQTWIPLQTMVDLEGNRLIAFTDHLTLYDFKAQNWEAARLPTLSNFQVSSFTGAATYSLPIELPPGPGGLQPSLTLSYNSQVVDSASSRSQASWVGMGWSLETGYIQRNMHGTNDFFGASFESTTGIDIDYKAGYSNFNGSDGDDTFSLVVNGQSWLLARVADTDGDPNTIDYRTTDESFWRIRRYHSHGNVGGYTGDTSYWVAWDKSGNQYYFGYSGGSGQTNNPNGHAWYPVFPAACGSPFMQTWQFALTKARNIYGKEISYTYQTEGAVKSCNYDQASMAVAIYPSEIRYPHSRYRVVFATINDRKDYDTAWLNNTTKVLFQRARLSEIRIEHDADQNGYFEQLIRKYVLTYTDGLIYPNLVWPASGKTPTLTKVQEYGLGGTNSLPATTFAYSDGMHLTEAANGYGGKVNFTYESTPWREVDGWEPLASTNAESISISGDVYLDELAAGNVFGTLKKYFLPGQYYRLSAEVWPNGGNTVELGIHDGTGTLYGSVFTLTGGWQTVVRYVKATSNATQGRPLIRCPACKLNIYKVTPVITRYRVTTKKITDQVTGQVSSFTYRYDEPATNDTTHSAAAGLAYPYSMPYSEFRGHAKVSEIGPDGRLTVRYSHQDDGKKGQTHTTISGSQIFLEQFESGTLSNYAVNWGFTPSDYTRHSITRVAGDNCLRINNPNPTWDVNTYRTSNSLTNDMAVLLHFRINGASVAAGYYADTGTWGTSSYRRWGVSAQVNQSLSASYHNGSGFLSPISMGLTIKPDTWYTLLLVFDNEHLFARAWERDNPSLVGRAEYNPGSNLQAGWSWRFVQQVSNGTTWIDDYNEVRVFKLNQTLYTSSASATPIQPARQAGGSYSGLSITWTTPSSSVAFTFEGNGDWAGTRTTFEYNTAYQGGVQYGNLTDSVEQRWNGSAWSKYRATRSRFYPNVTNSAPPSALYLVGLPGYSNQYSCPSGTCSYTNAEVISSINYIYDANTQFSQAPTQGKLTGQRTFIRWTGADYTLPVYADIKYEYDSYGNRTKQHLYKQENGTTFAAGTPQTTNTTYDGIYFTYALSVSQPVTGITTSWTYNYAYGQPISETGPNGAATTIYAYYDTFGRMTKLVRPGDSEASATVLITYTHPSSPFSSYPFRVSVQQKLVSATYFTTRKFYDGLGRLIQEQTAGAVLSSGTKDIVTNRWYDAYGSLVRQSVPYEVSTGSSAYRAPDTSQPSTSTIYDPLERPTLVTATDGTMIGFTYFDLETKVVDQRSKDTRYIKDDWGRTTSVVPPTGPSVSYTFDAMDRLIKVVRGGATTTLTYDFAGRKLTMNDPDMGAWSYAYDAIGNLVRQTDAKGQRTCLYYDAMNRLTGKYYQTTDACPSSPTMAVSYSYDAYNTASGQYGRGFRTGMSDSSGSTTWKYDTRGRLYYESKAITGSGTFLTQWSYNSADLVDSMTYPGDNAGNAGEVVSFSYHPQLLVNGVTGGNDTYVQGTSYDPAGRVDIRTLGSSILKTDYDYFAWTSQGGRLKTIKTGMPSTPTSLQSMEYSYDPAGNINWIKDYNASGTQTQTFVYDDLNRLTSAVASGGSGGAYATESYTYNATTGNLASKTGVGSYTYMDTAHKHAVTHLGGVQKYWYDANGNMTKRIIGASTYNLTFDKENHLTGVSGAATASFVYDGDGKRVRSVNAYQNLAAGAPASSDVTLYHPDVAVNGDIWANSGSGSDREFAYTSGGLHYLQVDLGAVYSVDKVKVWHYATDGRTYYNTKTEVSQDGVTWTTVFDSAVSGEYPETAAGKTHTFTARNVRYVRDWLNGSTINTGDHWVEIEVWGKATVSYVGNYFEWNGSTNTITKYYYAGGQRVAVRRGSTLSLLISDHLGSTAYTADPVLGRRWTSLRYKAWGEQRYAEGFAPTEFHFTGQKELAVLGLHDYGARWYDSLLGRWIQPDTIVPLESQGVQAWDRFAYANNNPVRYADPTGNWIESAFDILSIGYGIYDISQNGLNWENGLGLAADIVGLALPGVTGLGAMVRVASRADDAADALRTVNQASNLVQAGNQAQNGTQATNLVQNTTAFLNDVASRANRHIPGSGHAVGTQRHAYTRRMIDRYQSMNGPVGGGLYPEVSYKGGALVDYGTHGSVRLDIVEGNRLNPTAIYDFKFGSAGLSTNRINQIHRTGNFPTTTPIIEIRPQ